MSQLRSILLFLWLAFTAASPAAAQSSVVIWPVDPQIKAAEPATALWLENRGTAPVTLQVRSFAWSQGASEDSYRPQDAVISSPPIAQIGPGQRQLVRIIRRALDPAGEHAYRLLIDELPQPPAAGAEPVSARLAMQMRYSIPLFTYGDEPTGAAPKLNGRVELGDGKRWLVIANNGPRHARLTDLRLHGEKGDTLLKGGLLGYVLAGATMRWPLPDHVEARPALTIAVDGIDLPIGYSS